MANFFIKNMGRHFLLLTFYNAPSRYTAKFGAVAGSSMYQKFAILLLKGSPKQTWSMELFGKFPKNSPHFKDFLF
jgi:hypothetical protein